jgi:hypothetical protein
MTWEVNLLWRARLGDELKKHVSNVSPFHYILTVMRHHP